MTAAAGGAPAPVLFVGRTSELGELRAALMAARAGRGGLYLLSGEPGIGKTRLAEQVADDAAAAGGRVIWGRCWDGRGGIAYWPWLQVLRQALGEGEWSGRDDAAGVAVRHLMSREREQPAADVTRLPGRTIGDLDTDRLALFDAVQTVLTGVAAERPMLVVLDDLHAAAESSVLLLQYVAARLSEHPILMVATHRDWEMQRQPAMRRALAGLARGSRSITLRGLGEADVARVLRAADSVRAHPALVSAVHRATGGNPFFVHELVRVLQARGRLDAADLSPQHVAGVSLRVQEAVRRRLQSVSDACAAMLPVAAVVGPDFDRVILARVCNLPPQHLLEPLSEAVRAGLLVQRDAAHYAFSHGIIRDALYRAQPAAARAELHARVGAALESRPIADAEVQVAALAHHFGEAAQGAADPARAVRYLRAAAEQAMRRLAYEEAVALLQRASLALDLDPYADLAARADLLLALGDAERRAGETDAARQSFAHAARLARRLGDPAVLARAALDFGMAGRDPLTVDYDWISLLEEARSALGGADGIWLARVEAALALALYWAAGPARRLELSRGAVAMARRLGESGTLAFALHCELRAVWSPASGRDRLASAEEILSLARADGDRQLELEARQWKITSLIEQGDIGRVDKEIGAVAWLADEMHDPMARWYVLVWKAMRAALDGDLDRADRLAADALAAGERVTKEAAGAVFLGQVYQLRWLQGRLGEIREPLRALVDDGAAGSSYRCGLAHAAARSGDLALARRELEFVAAARFACLPEDFARVTNLVTLADVVAVTGAAEHAPVLYEELLPYAASLVVVGGGIGCFGAAARYLGLLAATMGRLDDAERHFDDALRLNARVGARPWLVYTQIDLASLLLRRGRPGDAARAAALREVALREAATLGLPVAMDAPDPVARAGSVGPCRFLLEGEFWTVRFAGVTARVRDSKGMRYLQLLLADPGEKLHVLAMVAEVDGAPPARSSAGMSDAGLGIRSSLDGDLGPALDRRARQEYRARRAELVAELDEAQAANDPGRCERAAREVAELDGHVARVLGLGGRRRAANKTTEERARFSVMRAIRGAMARVSRAHPGLGEHLELAVHTGASCTYAPDPRLQVRWDLTASG